MKKIIIVAVAVLVVATAYAQHEQMYIFRNDDNFDFFNASDITGMVFNPQSDVMTVGTADGETVVNMSVVDSCVIRTTAIPDVFVNLTEYPTVSDIFKGEGYTKETVYKATVQIKGNGMHEDLEEQSIEFRGRGNSTWKLAKTPYRFKMKKKESVCGLPKAKTFALIANYLDPSLMRNALALHIAGQLGLPFTNHSVPVNVYLNGYYKGAYMLTEKIGIGSGSVDIREDVGMLFELDIAYDEDFKFRYTWSDGGAPMELPVMVKDPDLAELMETSNDNAYWNKWQDDFKKMADVVTGVYSGKLADYIDLEQAAKYVLVNSVALNLELRHPKSCYIYKEGLGDGFTYRFGPVWDFDWSFGYGGKKTTDYTLGLFAGNGDCQGGAFFRNLCSNEEFRAVYKEVWNDFIDNVYPNLEEYIDRYAAIIEPSAKRDGLHWPDAEATAYAYAQSSYDHKARVNDLKAFLRKRVEFCNSDPAYGLY